MPLRSRARRAPTSPSWAAATPASGRRSASSSASRRATSSCSSRTSAAAARAVATAASRSRGGRSWGRSSQLCGRDGALAIARAAEEAVDEIGAFCERARHRRALPPRRAPLDGHVAGPARRMGRRDGDLPRARRDAVRGVDARADRASAADRTATSPACSSPRPRSSSRRCSCAGSAAWRSSSACASTRARSVTKLDRRSPAVLHTPLGVVTADRVVIATNAWAVGLRELHTRLAIISSDIVATVPMPERLREIGWTRHECISDSKLQISYYRTTDDGRIVYGKGGWGIALGDRIGPRFDRDEKRAREVAPRAPRDLPDARGRADRDRLVRADRPHAHRHPDLRAPRRAQPHRLRRRLLGQRRGARASWAARSSRRSRSASPTSGARCGLVDGRQGRFPPEPVRFLGAHVVREGVARKEEAETLGRKPSRVAVALARLAPAGHDPEEGRVGRRRSAATRRAPPGAPGARPSARRRWPSSRSRR